ncbi:unnamed protein product, partial [Iphiclides podalirius]
MSTHLEPSGVADVHGRRYSLNIRTEPLRLHNLWRPSNPGDRNGQAEQAGPDLGEGNRGYNPGASTKERPP